MKERASIAAGTDYINSHPVAQLLNAGHYTIHFGGINSSSAVPRCDPHLLSIVIFYNAKEMTNETVMRLTLLTFTDQIHLDLPILRAQAEEFLQYILPILKGLLLTLQHGLIKLHHLWRAHWSQPVTVKNYSKLIPAEDGPQNGFHICSVAQIYPDDGETKYSYTKAGSPEPALLHATIVCNDEPDND